MGRATLKMALERSREAAELVQADADAGGQLIDVAEIAENVVEHAHHALLSGRRRRATAPRWRPPEGDSPTAPFIDRTARRRTARARRLATTKGGRPRTSPALALQATVSWGSAAVSPAGLGPAARTDSSTYGAKTAKLSAKSLTSFAAVAS